MYKMGQQITQKGTDVMDCCYTLESGHQGGDSTQVAKCPNGKRHKIKHFRCIKNVRENVLQTLGNTSYTTTNSSKITKTYFGPTTPSF